MMFFHYHELQIYICPRKNSLFSVLFLDIFLEFRSILFRNFNSFAHNPRTIFHFQTTTYNYSYESSDNIFLSELTRVDVLHPTNISRITD